MSHFMRVVAGDVPAWMGLGWRLVGGHRSPSVGDVMLLEWCVRGEPMDPVDALYRDLGGEA